MTTPLPGSTILEASVAGVRTEGLHHYWCDTCGNHLALCGADISDEMEADDPLPGEDVCVMCDALIDSPCARCGDDR